MFSVCVFVVCRVLVVVKGVLHMFVVCWSLVVGGLVVVCCLMFGVYVFVCVFDCCVVLLCLCLFVYVFVFVLVLFVVCC